MGVGWGALQCPAGWRWRPPAHQGPHSLGPRPTPTPAPAPAGRAEGRGGAAQQLRHWRCGREEHGAQPRLLVTRCHLLLPRRRRAQTMATQAQGWAPANPKAAPLLTPTAPLPHSPCRSLRGDARLPAADPLGSLPYCHHLLHVPSLYLLNASFFRRQGRCHLLQKAFPGLLLSNSHRLPPLPSPWMSVLRPSWSFQTGQSEVSRTYLCFFPVSGTVPDTQVCMFRRTSLGVTTPGFQSLACFVNLRHSLASLGFGSSSVE